MTLSFAVFRAFGGSSLVLPASLPNPAACRDRAWFVSGCDAGCLVRFWVPLSLYLPSSSTGNGAGCEARSDAPRESVLRHFLPPAGDDQRRTLRPRQVLFRSSSGMETQSPCPAHRASGRAMPAGAGQAGGGAERNRPTFPSWWHRPCLSTNAWTRGCVLLPSADPPTLWLPVPTPVKRSRHR